MRASRHDPIAVPLGAIERPRNPCRELSALTDGDLATPAVWRRPERETPANTDQRERDAETRAEWREILVPYYTRRLGAARLQTALLASIGKVPLAQVERVARLERALDAARRLS